MKNTWSDLENGILKEASDAYLEQMLADLPDDGKLRETIRVSEHLDQKCLDSAAGKIHADKVVRFRKKSIRYIVAAAVLVVVIALSNALADPHTTERIGNWLLTYERDCVSVKCDIPLEESGQPLKNMMITFDRLPYDMQLENEKEVIMRGAIQTYKSKDGKVSLQVSVTAEGSVKSGVINTEKCEMVKDAYPQFDRSLFIGNDQQHYLLFEYQGVTGDLMYIGTDDEFDQILSAMKLEIFYED